MTDDAKVLKLYMLKDEYITDLHDNVDEHVKEKGSFATLLNLS
jgi:hypothetical protein